MPVSIGMHAIDPPSLPDERGDEFAPTSPEKAPLPRKRRFRWGHLVLLVFLVLGLSLWGARATIVTRAERQAIARLAEEGIYLTYSKRSWSPGRGLHLENVVLHRAAEDNRPVVEISALTIGAPLADSFRTRDLISTWRTHEATVTLHDSVGPIEFRRVTAHLLVHAGQIEVQRLEARQGRLSFDLPGQMELPPASGQPKTKPEEFLLDLSAVRGVLDTLAIQSAKSEFDIRGGWTLQLHESADAIWQADVAGRAVDLEWQGVPMRQVDIKGRVSNAGLNLTASLGLTAGTAQVTLSRADWDAAPLVLAGSFADAAGARDEFNASYDAVAGKVSLPSLSGQADLIAFARNFPKLPLELPEGLAIQKFPGVLIQDFIVDLAPKAGTAAWQVRKIEVRSPGSISLPVDGHSLQIALTGGSASFLNNTWKFQVGAGPVAWRDFRAKKVTMDGSIAGGKLKSSVDAVLPSGSVDLTLASDEFAKAPLEISGSFKDARGQTDRVAASFRHQTSTWEVARLDGRADLLEFAGNFPGVRVRLPEGMKLQGGFPEISVRNFSYRPGKPVTLGSLKLLSPMDLTFAVQGRSVGISRLSGQASFDGRAWKLTRLAGGVFGGQMNVDGLYEGDALRDATISATKLHLAQLKSWMGEAQESLGEGVLTFDYRGTLSVKNPAQVSGAGSLKVENAPVVKIPLLDQTYALFSALVSPLQRQGNGSLEAEFSAANGIVTISEFTAHSEAARVTATGTIDLKKREVDARARGNVRGVFGLATAPISRVLEMRVTGPLDQVRVRPLGFDNVLGDKLAGPEEKSPSAPKKPSSVAGDVIRNGISLPFRALGALVPGDEKR